MDNKYKIGDLVIISKKLSTTGAWQTVKTFQAKVADIKQTVTFGPAYCIEVNGNVLANCYWESDIDGFLSDNEDQMWKTWGDQ